MPAVLGFVCDCLLGRCRSSDNLELGISLAVVEQSLQVRVRIQRLEGSKEGYIAFLTQRAGLLLLWSFPLSL